MEEGKTGKGSVQYSQGRVFLTTFRVLGTTDVLAWARGGQ